MNMGYFPASHQREKTRLGALNLESEAIWGATFSEDICSDLLSFLCFLVVLVATMNPYESHRFLSFISVLEPLTARSLRLFFATTEDFADVVDDIKDSLESSKDQSLKELARNGFPKISSRVKERPWRKKPVLQVQIVYPPVFWQSYPKRRPSIHSSLTNWNFSPKLGIPCYLHEG